MPLVEYLSESDSVSESETSAPQLNPTSTTNATKRKAQDDIHSNPTTLSPPPTLKKPPPLPSTFHTLYTITPRTSTTDDPSLHGGRKRQITHVTGNWPSHIYLEWLPTKPQLSTLDSLLLKVQNLLTEPTTSQQLSSPNPSLKLNSFSRTPLNAQAPLHISLSAPLVLNTSTKAAFLERLITAIKEARFGSIVVTPVSLDLVPNFERSRWFLVLRVREVGGGKDGARGKLVRVLDVCNRVCKEFGLVELYKSGGRMVGVSHGDDGSGEADGVVGCGDVTSAFHVSVAWMLAEVSEQVRDVVRKVDLEELKDVQVEFGCVRVKIGNVVEEVRL